MRDSPWIKKYRLSYFTATPAAQAAQMQALARAGSAILANTVASMVTSLHQQGAAGRPLVRAASMAH